MQLQLHFFPLYNRLPARSNALEKTVSIPAKGQTLFTLVEPVAYRFELLLQFNPDIIIVDIGTNDSGGT